jgi:transaldolase
VRIGLDQPVRGTTLERLNTEYGQSPWLDNLTRGHLRDGTLARLVAEGIRGVTANPTIFTKAIMGSADYDEQFSEGSSWCGVPELSHTR